MILSKTDYATEDLELFPASIKYMVIVLHQADYKMYQRKHDMTEEDEMANVIFYA